MSLTITRAQHKLNFKTGSKPTESQFASLIDAFPMIYVEESVTLVANTDFQVTHNGGEKARIVQVTDSNGQEIEVSWRRDPSDPTNKVLINSAKAYTGAEVSILLK